MDEENQINDKLKIMKFSLLPCGLKHTFFFPCRYNMLKFCKHFSLLLATWPAHLNLIDLFILTILDEWCKLWNSSFLNIWFAFRTSSLYHYFPMMEVPVEENRCDYHQFLNRVGPLLYLSLIYYINNVMDIKEE